MFNFWRAWNLCLLNIWYLLTKFSASTSLWFWYNSKLNIWCSTWHANQVEGVKMRVLIADDVLTFFSFWTKNEHKSFFKNWSGLLKRSFYWWCKKKTFHRNEVLFLQSVITSEWLLWVLWSSFLFKDSISWTCLKGNLDYYQDWGKSLPYWIDAATNLLCIRADSLMFKFLEGWCKPYRRLSIY